MHWRGRATASLQQRVAMTLVVFAIVTSCIVGVAGYWINETVQQHTRLATLIAELESTRDLADGKKDTPRTPMLTTYRALLATADFLHVPKPLRKLQPGFYAEFKIDKRKHSVLVRDSGSTRYFLAYDISRPEQRETGIGIAITTTILVLIVAVFFIGTWLARNLVAQVLDFSNRVSTFDPSARGLRIGNAYHQVKEIDTIAQAFDRYLQSIDAYVEREQEFTRAASHELRTPIGTISGALDVIEGSSEIPLHIQQPLVRIRRATRGLSDTITALLYLAREEGEGPPAGSFSCQVDKLIPDIVDDHRYLIGTKNLSLQIGELEPTSLLAPPRIVIIALSNLIRNAIEHNAAGQIEISLCHAVFNIQDEGEGFSTDQLEDINHGVPHGGSRGFGFYIIQQICQRLGWHLEISDHSASGAQISLDMSSCHAR